ncbi:MAG: hypothetical protein IJG51_02435 [Synergistaceae bacterium]|nr:hypothetical protein [Synergistaceae bacterium]MBQ3397726.1 hypothetical protein [Synergistaceae bacterium]MBQ6114245.1 hypothetical protein [Synergistaceae bacterium]MBQ6417401.1 hypothetical protein [Synergistaceae bacterium]MBQ6664624.1 hypothetical protein [Synergistaceae bacterium]
MRKIYLALMLLSLFAISGCGGGGSSSHIEEKPHISPDVKEVMVLSSPAFERNKRYRIYTGARLSGMNGAKYYVANTGSEAVQSTLNLGFSEQLKAGESFIIVNDSPDSADHSGGIVFAYDPSGVNDSFTSGGNIAFTGGNLMRYRTLSLADGVNTAENETGHKSKPYDATVYAKFESGRGTTTFAMGSGTYLSFIEDDEEYYLSRDIPPSGNVLRLVRRVNTFSGMIKEY